MCLYMFGKKVLVSLYYFWYIFLIWVYYLDGYRWHDISSLILNHVSIYIEKNIYFEQGNASWNSDPVRVSSFKIIYEIIALISLQAFSRGCFGRVNYRIETLDLFPAVSLCNLKSSYLFIWFISFDSGWCIALDIWEPLESCLCRFRAGFVVGYHLFIILILTKNNNKGKR